MTFIQEMQGNEPKQYVEVYEIRIGSATTERVTSFEEDYIYAGNVYKAITIDRGDLKYEAKFKPQAMKITLPLTQLALSYLAQVPPEDIKFSITRVIKDQPTIIDVMYDGEVLGVDFTEKSATFSLESNSKLFREQIPNTINSATCNNILFDEGCALLELNYSLEVNIVSLTSNNTIIEVSDKLLFPYTLGKIRTTYGDVRWIINESGNFFTVQVPFDSRVAEGSTIYIIPGCNRLRSTCEGIYNNVDNYVGMPEIPTNNEVVWGIAQTNG